MSKHAPEYLHVLPSSNEDFAGRLAISQYECLAPNLAPNPTRRPAPVDLDITWCRDAVQPLEKSGFPHVAGACYTMHVKKSIAL